MTFLLAVLIASLLGSVHCAAMCGPFACLYTTSDGKASRSGTTAYHLGRLISYLSLGVLAGSIGLSLDRLKNVGISAALVSGLLMVIWGGTGVIAALSHRRLAKPRPALGWIRLSGGVLGSITDASPATRGLTTGLLTTLLPCGWLYVFVVAAGGTGSPLKAVSLMTAFWLGTVPMLTITGLTLAKLTGPLRSRLPLIAAAIVLILGLLALAGHFNLISLAPHQFTVPFPDGGTHLHPG